MSDAEGQEDREEARQEARQEGGEEVVMRRAWDLLVAMAFCLVLGAGLVVLLKS